MNLAVIFFLISSLVYAQSEPQYGRQGRYIGPKKLPTTNGPGAPTTPGPILPGPQSPQVETPTQTTKPFSGGGRYRYPPEMKFEGTPVPGGASGPASPGLAIGEKKSARTMAEDFDRIGDLAENARDIILSNPKTHPNPYDRFKLKRPEADRMASFISMDRELSFFKFSDYGCGRSKDFFEDPKLRQRELNNENSWRIIIGGKYGGLSKKPQNSKTKRLRDSIGSSAFDIAVRKNAFNMNIPLEKRRNLFAYSSGFRGRSLRKLANSYNNNNKSIYDLDLKTGMNELKNYFFDKTGVNLTKAEAESFFTDYIIGATLNDTKNWKKTLAMAKDHISFNQKVELTSRLGGDMGANYNYDRADQDEAGRFVGVVDLLESIKSKSPGGVCRDVTEAQTRMLHTLGVEAYGIAYRTARGKHVSVYTQDPNSKEITKINYGHVQKTSGGTGTALLHNDGTTGNTDAATRDFEVFDWQGKPVGEIATDFGNMIRQLAKVPEKNPLVQNNYSIGKVGVENDDFTGVMFHGRTSLGNEVRGISLSAAGGDNFIKGRLGFSAGQFEENKSETMNITSEYLYGNLGLEVSHPTINVGGFSMRTSVGGDYEIFGAKSKVTTKSPFGTSESKEKNFVFDTDINLDAGLFLSYEFNENNRLDGSFSTHGYVESSHLAEGTKTTLAKNYDVFDLTYHKKFDELNLSLQAGGVLRELGDSYWTKAALSYASKEGTSLGASVQYVKPDDKNMPLFVPGSTESLKTSVFYRPSRSMTFTIDYTEDFETGESQVFFGGTIGGR